MANIKDVALEAGVSVGTVSNVLNQKKHVKKEKEERVLAAIEKLGFQYNLTAKTLRTQKSNDIGLILPNIRNPYYPEVARGIEDKAQEKGLSVFLCNTDRNKAKEREYIRSLLAKNIRGLIIVKHQLPDEELLELCQTIPLVLADENPHTASRYKISSINNDDFGGIQAGLKYLQNNGHKKLGFIYGLNDSYSSTCRYRGFIDYCLEHGIEIFDQYIINGNYSMDGGYKAALKILKCAELPTAILAANDLMAIGAMRAFQEKGLNVPEDISIMGYDDINFANIVTPALTTIHQPTYELGIKSVELLLNNNLQNVVISGNKIICRNSVKKK